jgi:hypothetical protein
MRFTLGMPGVFFFLYMMNIKELRSLQKELAKKYSGYSEITLKKYMDAQGNFWDPKDIDYDNCFITAFDPSGDRICITNWLGAGWLSDESPEIQEKFLEYIQDPGNLEFS